MVALTVPLILFALLTLLFRIGITPEQREQATEARGEDAAAGATGRHHPCEAIKESIVHGVPPRRT
jgi:hypothetical protein